MIKLLIKIITNVYIFFKTVIPKRTFLNFANTKVIFFGNNLKL